MPHRIGPDFPDRARVQVVCSSRVPALVRKAAVKRGLKSNTEWINLVVAEALERELGSDVIEVDDLIADAPRGLSRGHKGRFTAAT